MKFVMDTSKYWFKPSISRDRGEAGKAPGCDLTLGSGLSPELSGVPVGSQWGQIKSCWGLLGVEGISHWLRGAAQKQGLCHSSSVSSKSSMAWAVAECPGDCRD